MFQRAELDEDLKPLQAAVLDLSEQRAAWDASLGTNAGREPDGSTQSWPSGLGPRAETCQGG